VGEDLEDEGFLGVFADWEEVGVVVDGVVSVCGATGRRRRASFGVDIATAIVCIASREWLQVYTSVIAIGICTRVLGDAKP